MALYSAQANLAGFTILQTVLQLKKEIQPGWDKYGQ